MPPVTDVERDAFYAKLNQDLAGVIFSPFTALDKIKDRIK